MEGIYDAHVHLGPSGEWLPYLDPEEDAESIIDAMDKACVQKSIIFPNPAVGDRYPELNDIIQASVEEYPDRFIGFGRVDPRRGDEAVGEVERCYDMGLKGIKLHPFVETFRPDHPNFHKLFDTIYEREMIILTHTGQGFASAGLMKKALEERKDMIIILGHLNEGCISMAERFDNVYIDTSGTRVYMLEYACQKVPDKILFGSDHPYLNYAVQKMVVEEARMSDEVRNGIFVDNLKGLLKALI